MLQGSIENLCCPVTKWVFMNINILAVSFLNGISYGMILFLIACGFSLIFGVMGILNLAHGALYMLGAYFGLTVASYGTNFFLAALAGAVGAGLVGLVLERSFLAHLYKQIDEQVLLTLGIVYIFSNMVLWIWGPFPKMGVAPVSGYIDVGTFSFPTYRLLLIVVGLAVAIGLYFFQERSRYGAIIRAGMYDKRMTMGLGINYGLVSSLVFILGAFMAGLAGFIGAPIVGAYPSMSFEILLLALVVIVIGGVGYIQGALLGAILIGLIDAFGKAFFPDFAMFTIYLVMIIVLLVKPAGLLGRAR
jgi:branched-chain amino acid transport system permease protein